METGVTSLVLAFLWHGVTAFLCDYASGVTVQRNTYLQVPVFTSHFGLSLYMCDRKCSNVIGSLSYNYFRPDGKCECMGETSANSSQTLVSREDWHHGNITTLDKTFSTNCTSTDCQACSLEMPALIRCPLACLPPPLSGFTAHVTAVSPTAATSYTCLEDFTFLGSSSHVICTAEGTWEGLNGTCQQTSWTNPMQRQFPIPQPVEANWREENVFKITGNTAEGINLRDGSDIPFLVSMRINYLGQNYTVLNSIYADAWQTDARVYNAPWRTGLVFNVTIVLNCPALGFQSPCGLGSDWTHPACPGELEKAKDSGTRDLACCYSDDL